MTNAENSPHLQPPRRRLTGWRIAAWTGAGLVLMIPLVAMRFTDGVRWTGFDFAVAAAMLAALVGAAELAVRLSDDWLYRAGVAVAAVAAFLLLWAQGAVGLVGSENDLFNLLFFLPLGVGAIGALVVRFRSRGLSLTLGGMAALQAGTVAVGYAITRDTDAFLLCAWVVAWALSAGLFGRAAPNGEARA